MPLLKSRPPLMWLVYSGLATLQFIRFYSISTIFYLNMPAYLSGHERLPFQERILPVLFMTPIFHSHWVMHFAHSNGPFTAERGPFYLLSLIAFLIAGIFTQKLYRAATYHNTLGFLVYPVFLLAAMWSYAIHSEANYSYPYDMPAVAFFAAGLYFTYTRQFLPLLITILLGTLNRETTLFLIGIYILDAASTGTPHPTSLRERFSLSLIPWGRVAVLILIWAAVKGTVAHIFATNDSSENYDRIFENIGRLTPRLWPALLNVCGYLLPIVLVFRANIRPYRLANYLYILPFWFGVMFYAAVIVETRIYGELCSFVAVVLVLILERHMALLPVTEDDPSIAPHRYLEHAA
jgi:hypothetical protein